MADYFHAPRSALFCQHGDAQVLFASPCQQSHSCLLGHAAALTHLLCPLNHPGCVWGPTSAPARMSHSDTVVGHIGAAIDVAQ